MCLLEHRASVSVQARLRSHLILAWGKCSVSFEANAHLCPASSYYNRKENVTSSKSCGEGLLKYSSVFWFDECFLVQLYHSLPHRTLSRAANPESVTTVLKLQNFQNANTHFSFLPRCFLANDNKDWKEAGKFVGQNGGRNFQIHF